MENFVSFYNDLKKLIAIKSVKGSAQKNAPFGKGIKEALTFMLDLAESFGFKTTDYDGYIGEVTFGEGDEIGIIGHLDVVPAMSGWDSPPFTLTEKNGVLYGRGISDDKTPMLMTLYILKSIKDDGVVPKRKIRLFFGCDEETGWQDIEYLKTKTALPEYGFSPDGDFPVSYAEKGIYFVNFFLPKLKNFSGLTGGTVINAVCGQATVKPLKDIDKSLLLSLGLTQKNGIIESVGISSHGSKPESGKNAMLPLFRLFASCGEKVENVVDCLFYDKYKLSSLKTEQGAVTLSPDIVEENENGIVIKCDCRIPAPLKKEDVEKVIKKFGIPFTMEEKHPPMMVEKNGFLVNALSSAYTKVTGEKVSPVAQSGSTFARVFKKGVAFGPEFPNDNSFIHKANEHVRVDDVEKLYNIYKTAIYNLIK